MKKKNSVFSWAFKTMYMLDKKYTILWLIVAVLIGLLNGVIIIFSEQLINSLSYENISLKIVFLLILGWQACTLINAIYIFIDEIMDEILLTNFGPKLQKKIMEKVRGFTLRTIEKEDYNAKYSRAASYRIHRLSCFFVEFARLLVSIVSYAVTIVIISNIERRLIFYGIFLVIIKIVANKNMAKKWVDFSDDIEKETQQETYYFQLLGNIWQINEIRMLSLMNFIKKRWRTSLESIYDKRIKMSIHNKWIAFIFSCIDNAIGVVVCLFFLYLLYQGKIRIGTFVVAVNIVNMANQSVAGIFGHFEEMCSIISDLKGQMDFFNMKEDVSRDASKSVSTEDMNTDDNIIIKVENLDFKYNEGEKNTLENINFTINRGEVVAFVGENGSGKSTMIKILLGAYNKQKGIIQFNGKDYDKLCSKFLNNHIGSTMQNFITYMYSVRKNIGLSLHEHIDNDDEIWDALRKGDADEIIRREANGNIDKNLIKWFNDDAIDLSYGQLQRLAVSRAYFGGRELIILDEPSAALDPIAEWKQFDNIRKKDKDTTAIIISHRIGYAKMVDKIVVFKDGKVVECGNHEELIRNKGEYEHLFKSQAKWYHEEEFLNYVEEV